MSMLSYIKCDLSDQILFGATVNFCINLIIIFILMQCKLFCAFLCAFCVKCYTKLFYRPTANILFSVSLLIMQRDN